MSHSLTNSPTLNQYRTDEKSSSDSSGAELRGEAGSCYLQRHSPSLRLRLLLFHTTFWFDPRQKDLTEVWTEAEGEGRIRFLLWCIECGCSVGWSRCSFFFYCFRLVSSSQLTWSPLHSVIISLPCSHFLLWGENQPDSVAPPHPAPSISPPSSSESDRSSMFLLVSPHGLHPSLLLQRFVWEVVFTSTRLLSSLSWTLILLRRVRLRIVLITHRSSHTADVHLQTVTDVYVLSKEPKQEVLHEKARKRPDQQDKC